jgi:putative ABC transport system permease protein
MRIFAIIKIAARALQRNKLRTVLTMLGIIMGVGAVIAMVSIGDGAKAMVEKQIANLGQNVIQVLSGSVGRGGLNTGWGSAGTLTIDDANSIDREVEGVSTVSPEVRTMSQVAAGNQNWFTQIMGEGEGYLDLRQWPLAEGAMFSEQDVRSANKVAVIGKTTARQLYGEASAIGQIIRVKAVPFIIVGELIPKGLGFGGNDQDDVLIIPYTSAMKRVTGATTLRSINVQAENADAIPSVQNQIIDLLRQRHRTGQGRDDDFNVRTQQEIAEVVTASSRVMTMLLAAIASVSLLVGGIGIMNIMLVSVTERTREIGIRMAVGAKGRDILMQFLIEAVTLSAVGGAIGIGLGIGSSRLLASKMNWPTLTSPTWIVIAFVFSAAVGIIFGFYPAHKASQLDPIDALRYE